MNKYEFKGQYGDYYSFSEEQIERNEYLTRDEKDIVLGLAAWQSSNKPSIYPTNKVHKYEYDVPEVTYGRRTLTKTPVNYDVVVDIDEKRWYETWDQFAKRKATQFKKANTVVTKEVKRETIKIDRSTFQDGTEITKWDRDLKYFY